MDNISYMANIPFNTQFKNYIYSIRLFPIYGNYVFQE